MVSVRVLLVTALLGAVEAQKVSNNARCGRDFGMTCAGSKYGNCCSQYGYCGNDNSYCAASVCQNGYGSCNGQSPPNQAPCKPSTVTITRPGQSATCPAAGKTTVTSVTTVTPPGQMKTCPAAAKTTVTSVATVTAPGQMTTCPVADKVTVTVPTTIQNTVTSVTTVLSSAAGEIITVTVPTTISLPGSIVTSLVQNTLTQPAEVSTITIPTTITLPAEVSTLTIPSTVSLPAEVSTITIPTTVTLPAEVSTLTVPTTISLPAIVSTITIPTTVTLPAEVSTLTVPSTVSLSAVVTTVTIPTTVTLPAEVSTLTVPNTISLSSAVATTTVFSTVNACNPPSPSVTQATSDPSFEGSTAWVISGGPGVREYVQGEQRTGSRSLQMTAPPQSIAKINFSQVVSLVPNAGYRVDIYGKATPGSNCVFTGALGRTSIAISNQPVGSSYELRSGLYYPVAGVTSASLILTGSCTTAAGQTSLLNIDDVTLTIVGFYQAF